ncbi:helix-turn-helix transcriptional regulator [Micromonospora psammae]|uniref:helix-turn-helix transcriptional regulator n=1 Tax=Micromonospora sp. CPCC 205556 TaxID=3122398 RepID=UPI002FF1EE12
MARVRRTEADLLDGMLERTVRGSGGAAVVVGEPGMGKTSLLADVEARARQRGMRVLRCRGVESERDMPFAGLHELLRPCQDGIEQLAGPQRAALDSALGLSDRPAERFLVSVAVLGLLVAVAEERPVVVLVDDMHWLDPDSRNALLFAARRLALESVCMVLAARRTPEWDVGRAGPPVIELGPLSDTEAAAVLAERHPEIVPPVSEWLLTAAAGIPLVLFELASTLDAAQLSGTRELPPDPVVGPRLRAVLLSDVQRLGPDARRVLLLAAAEGGEDMDLLLRAAKSLGIGAEAFDALQGSGAVWMDRGRVRFRHPLIRQAVYEDAGPAARMAAHRALAEAGDPERRAWHLAAAAEGPDEGIAVLLERQAEVCLRRGATGTAERALVRAAELSESDAVRMARTVRAAEAAWQSGEREQAQALAGRVDERHADAPTRGRLLALRGITEYFSCTGEAAHLLLVRAARELAPTDAARAAKLLAMAVRAAWAANLPSLVAETGVQGAALLSAEPSLARPLGHLVQVSAARSFPDCGSNPGPGDLGEGERSADLRGLFTELAPTLADSDRDWVAIAALLALACGTEDIVHRAYVTQEQRLRSGGAVGQLAVVLSQMSTLEVAAGRWTTAVSNAAEGGWLAEQSGQPATTAVSDNALAWVAAMQGRERDCRERADRTLRFASEHGINVIAAGARWHLALLELGMGRPDAAMDVLLPVVAPGGPSSHPSFAALAMADLTEAAVRCGRLTEIRGSLEEAAQGGLESDIAWARSAGHRMLGLLATAERQTPAADETAAGHFTAAIDAATAAGRPFDLAHTRLLHGELLRRRKQRGQALPELRAAYETFDRLGATPWRERARREIQAAGDQVASSTPDILEDLTPQELQISRLAASGLTNKQIADRLFISPRTVGYHLYHVFPKLGVTSRSQLREVPELRSE